MRYVFTFIISLWAIILIAQNNTDAIRINFEVVDYGLAEVFEEITKEHGIHFSYATEAILEVPRITVDFKNASITEVMQHLLEGLDMEFRLIDNNVLVRKSADYTEVDNQEYQESIHIRGRVVQLDKHQAQVGLDMAAISVTNTLLGTYTDEEGFFDIEIPQKYFNEDIIVHYLGFGDIVYKLKELDSHFLLIHLSGVGFNMDEVVIVNKVKPIKIATFDNRIVINFNESTSNAADLGGADVSKRIQLLPGVSAINDASADIKIRGGQDDETLMILDGMPIYNANHYYGVFSAFNADYIEEVKLYQNAFPADYGGVTSGIVALSSSDEISEVFDVSAEINLLNTSLKTSLPISKNASILFAGRTTIKDISNTQFNSFATESNIEAIVDSFGETIPNIKSIPSFKFYDLNTKFLWQPSSNQKIKINFFNSNDALSNEYQRLIKDNKGNEIKVSTLESEMWSSLAANIQYSVDIGPSWSATGASYITYYKNQATIDFDLYKKQGGNNQSPDIEVSDKLTLIQDNEVRDIGVDMHIDYKDDTSSFRLGVAYVDHDIGYKFDENNFPKLGEKTHARESSLYSNFNFKIRPNIELNTGLRLTHYDMTEQLLWSPRLLVKYQMNDRWTLKAAYGRYQQVLRELDFEYRAQNRELWVLSDSKAIPILHSENYMVGATAILDLFTIDIELYQKNMEGVLEYADITPANGNTNMNLSRDYRLFRGDGLCRGIDITLSSSYKNYTSYISYTLSKLTESYSSIYNGKYFPSEDDRRHQLKWVNSIKMNKFSFNWNYIFTSGRRYTDFNGLGSTSDIRDVSPEDRFSYLPAYRRVDIGTSYLFDLVKLKACMSISVLNLLNNQNVSYIQSVASQITQNNNVQNTIIGNESTLLNRTFNISFKLSF